MELLLTRKARNEKATIGELRINGVFECFILEDRDRLLDQHNTLDMIRKIKVHGQTAIPAGRYRIIVNRSARFQKDLPLLLLVPGYEGIRIHTGNSSKDTEGCLIPGTWDGKGKDWVSNSRIGFDPLMAKIQKALKAKEQVWITIERKYPPEQMTA